ERLGQPARMSRRNAVADRIPLDALGDARELLLVLAGKLRCELRRGLLRRRLRRVELERRHRGAGPHPRPVGEPVPGGLTAALCLAFQRLVVLGRIPVFLRRRAGGKKNGQDDESRASGGAVAVTHVVLPRGSPSLCCLDCARWWKANAPPNLGQGGLETDFG